MADPHTAKSNEATIKRRYIKVKRSTVDAVRDEKRIPLFEQEWLTQAEKIARFVASEESDGRTDTEDAMSIAEILSGTDPDATLDEVSDEEEDTGPDRSSASEHEEMIGRSVRQPSDTRQTTVTISLQSPRHQMARVRMKRMAGQLPRIRLILWRSWELFLQQYPSMLERHPGSGRGDLL